MLGASCGYEGNQAPRSYFIQTENGFKFRRNSI